jgi:hypothetical protein
LGDASYLDSLLKEAKTALKFNEANRTALEIDISPDLLQVYTNSLRTYFYNTAVVASSGLHAELATAEDSNGHEGSSLFLKHGATLSETVGFVLASVKEHLIMSSRARDLRDTWAMQDCAFQLAKSLPQEGSVVRRITVMRDKGMGSFQEAKKLARELSMTVDAWGKKLKFDTAELLDLTLGEITDLRSSNFETVENLSAALKKIKTVRDASEIEAESTVLLARQ